MTFDELFSEHNLTADERKKLVQFLATFRAQKTVEVLDAAPQGAIQAAAESKSTRQDEMETRAELAEQNYVRAAEERDFLRDQLATLRAQVGEPTALEAAAELFAKFFNRMPIAALRDDVPADLQKRAGEFMFENGYRMVFDRWYLQAEPTSALALQQEPKP